MVERKPSGKRNGTLGNSRDRAAPVGMTVKTKIERGDRYSAPEIYNLEITVLNLLRGKEAWDRIGSQGASESDFKAGFEPILTYIRFGYFSKGRGFRNRNETYKIAEASFIAISGDGKIEYEVPSLVKQPQPQLINIPIIPGDIKEGWIALQVFQGEKEPFLLFRREYSRNTYGFWGPVWFQLFS